MKKGFTLVELLAVIVILAIILAIAIPSISDVISNTSKNAFGADAKLVLKGLNYKLLENEAFDVTSVNETNIESLLKISDENYQSVDVFIESGKPYVVILGKNKWNDLMVYGTYDNIGVESIFDGLLAYWKLDGNASDSSGNNNNGTIYGATLTTNNKGEANKAYLLDGIDDYIDFGSNVTLTDNNPFSYSVWIKFSTSQASKTIMGKHTNTPGGASLGIDDTTANRIKFHINSYTTQRINSTAALNDNVWHLITGTWGGTTLNLYIDGVLNSSASVVTSLTYPALNFQVGRWVGGSNQYFSGAIDDIRIYDKALTANEIKAIYYITK